VSNALEYSRPDVASVLRLLQAAERKGRDARLAIRNEGECLYLIEISDNGIGFQEKYADNIFNVFTRLESVSLTRGLGIGLAIVKRVVERHHGFVWAESEPGKDSMFRLLLPASVTLAG
jgi:signal transduction histidine kinase